LHEQQWCEGIINPLLLRYQTGNCHYVVYTECLACQLSGCEGRSSNVSRNMHVHVDGHDLVAAASAALVLHRAVQLFEIVVTT
jgi:hypothetical protein